MRENQQRAPLTRTICTFALAIVAVGCAVKEAVERVQPTAFIENPDLLQAPENTPFDLAWMSPTVRSWQYDTILVSAVRTDRVNAKDWIYSTSALVPTEGMYVERVNDLATYLQQAVSASFEGFDPDGPKVQVIEGLPHVPVPRPAPPIPLPSPGASPIEAFEQRRQPPRTIRLELSIAQVDFGDPLIYGSMLAVPVPAAANLSTAVKSPSLTIEARLIDEQTNELVGELVDRRFPQLKPIDVNRLFVSSAVRELSDSFAEDAVEAFYRKPGERVDSRFPFSLLPW